MKLSRCARTAQGAALLNKDEGRSWSRWLRLLGSLRITLWLFIIFAVLILAHSFTEEHPPLLIALPLLLLALNLLAALVTTATLRCQLPLLIFHLALLALLLLIAIGRLSSFDGEIELTTGEAFNGVPSAAHSGPWHRTRLDQLKFMLRDFSIRYVPDSNGISRDVTECKIAWIDERGVQQDGIIGDHLPLLLHGYRIYTTANKGFAPLFRWQTSDGAMRQGSIHLPSWPAQQYNQALEWPLAGSNERVWTQLQFDEAILDPAHPSQFRPPSEHILVMRVGAERHELRPGDSINLGYGILTYLGLRTWMGFHITSDWTLPWLIAAGVIAALSLAWHYARRFAAVPWGMGESTGSKELLGKGTHEKE